MLWRRAVTQTTFCWFVRIAFPRPPFPFRGTSDVVGSKIPRPAVCIQTAPFRRAKMKRWMKRPSSWEFPELRPSFRLISKREARICQQCQAQLMEGTRFLFCPQCETRVPRNVAHENQEYQEAIEHYTKTLRAQVRLWNDDISQQI